jgi:hypothetical protein
MFHTKDTQCSPVVIDTISRRKVPPYVDGMSKIVVEELPRSSCHPLTQAEFEHINCLPPESEWIAELACSVPIAGKGRTAVAQPEAPCAQAL